MTSHPSLLPDHAKKIEEIKVAEVRLSEYIEYDDIGLPRSCARAKWPRDRCACLARRTTRSIRASMLLSSSTKMLHPWPPCARGFSMACHSFARISELPKPVVFKRKEAGNSKATASAPTASFFVCPGWRTKASRQDNIGIRTGLSEMILQGVTRNPWDLDRSTGGSSARAAAAVAACIVPIAHASDRSRSIRFSASWCGLVGLLPSRGRISGGPSMPDSNFGLSRQFILCRIVRDMAAALDVFPGRHPSDPFVIVQLDGAYIEGLSQPTGTLRVSPQRGRRPASLLHACTLGSVPNDQSRPAEPAGAATARLRCRGSIRHQRSILRPVCLNPSPGRASSAAEASKIPALAVDRLSGR